MDIAGRSSGSSTSVTRGGQIGSKVNKAAVEEEMKRITQLPPTSVYVTHRLRVLNKILQLLSAQRSASQDEELELLFAGLHM